MLSIAGERIRSTTLSTFSSNATIRSATLTLARSEGRSGHSARAPSASGSCENERELRPAVPFGLAGQQGRPGKVRTTAVLRAELPERAERAQRRRPRPEVVTRARDAHRLHHGTRFH